MRKATLAILAITLVLVFGCTQSQQPVVQEPTPPVTVPQQNTTIVAAAPCSAGNVVQNDGCFLSLAKEKNDVSYCSNIYSADTLDVCLSNFANQSLDVCKTIRNADLRATCLTANAQVNKSEDICNLIDNVDARANCLKTVLPRCKLIYDPDARALCMALEKNDYTLCQSDACFVQYAENKSDANACSLVKSDPDKYYCLALVRQSAAECNNAPTSPAADSCYEMAAKAFNDPGTCSLATTGSAYQDSCYLYFAVSQKNMDYCARPNDEVQRDQCYSDYATQTADTASCLKIVNSLNRIGCYYFAAAANNMPSLCNPLEQVNQRSDCYSRGTSSDSGPVASDCAKVADEDWRNKCYYRAARVSFNQSLCVPITPGPDKDSCDQLFGQ